VVSTSAMVIAVSALAMNSGINDVFPHLFYIPIILTAYWFPRLGVFFSALMGLSYVTEFHFFSSYLQAVPSSELTKVLSRSLIFILVGSVMTLLRWEGFMLNEIIQDCRKFVFLGDRQRGVFYFSPSVFGTLDTETVRRMQSHGVTSILSQDDREEFLRMREDVMQGQEALGEMRFPGQDGRELLMSIRLSPRCRQGRVTGYKAMVEDITQSKEYERRIKAALDEKTVILAELHHRVRNNLAIVDSLINMQLMNAENPEVKACLQDMESRISAISEVHSSIFQEENVVDIDLRSHFYNLFRNNQERYEPTGEFSLDMDLEDLPMSFELIMDLSLVINELFSNSFKHAFQGQGRASLSLSIEDGEVVLLYSDDGPGLKDGTDLDAQKTFGLKFISRMVTGKMRGHLRPQYEPGGSWEIHIPMSSETVPHRVGVPQ